MMWRDTENEKGSTPEPSIVTLTDEASAAATVLSIGRPEGPKLLEARGLAKRYGGVRAIRSVSLTLGRGEVLAIVGENGAGKSTLMNLLAGVDTPDEGSITLLGRPVTIRSAAHARALGIALIHQEPSLADGLSVAENVLLGREPRRFGLIDNARLQREARRVMDQVGLDVSPRALAGSLSPGLRQLVQVARALAVDARVLIMDEPTSSLGARESERLLGLVQHLVGEGIGVLYVSHRLAEVDALGGRVLVLRDGACAGEIPPGQGSPAHVTRLMTGHDHGELYLPVRAPSRPAPGAPALEVLGLRTRAHPRRSLDLTVHAGEIVGIAGLLGSGRTEALEAIFGITPALAGAIYVDGARLDARSPRDAIRAGIALVPEDRALQGVILTMSVEENLSLARPSRASLPLGLIDRHGERGLAEAMAKRLDIRAPSADIAAGHLSGGNQQKVVLGKWLSLAPRVLLLDEPTRGVDVGARRDIYRWMAHLAAEGTAILFTSSELSEIVGLADRALVMHAGGTRGELAGRKITEAALLGLAADTPSGRLAKIPVFAKAKPPAGVL